MKRLVATVVIAVAAAVLTSDSAQAGHPAGYPFFPWGFYQPYGARYGTAIQTPPYFATNPPVYYGARFARPYGMSPFASPPMVNSPAGYQGRLRSEFHEPPRETPAPTCNPYLCKSTDANKYVTRSAAVALAPPVKKGPVHENPFFKPEEDTDKLAAN